MPALLQSLFPDRIRRRIEEVVKVDQTDDAVLVEELSEYVVTASICRQQTEILEAYLEAARKPHEGTAIWISGFFGSGKSSFAKLLGLAMADRSVAGEGAAARLGRRIPDTKAQVLLRQIAELVPTEAVVFDVSTDRGIRSGNQSITEIMYRQLLQHLGYPRELDLAALEISLEGEGRLDTFKARYQALHGRDWDRDKGLPALAMGRASAVMHALEPSTYNAPDSWARGLSGREDITPALLAERCLLLLGRRSEKRNLLFVVDEVGQFVARDPDKLEDLRVVTEQLGKVGRGRVWVMVTSQEQLSELISGLDQTRVQLPKVRDRFPLQVHLEPSDIAEVTSRRVLDKTAEGRTVLRALYESCEARLARGSALSAPNLRSDAWALTPDRFIDLYPLLPYQVDLIIAVVSGLRTQGGAARHVGGANRTIIKLAQQLLIHPEVDLAGQPLGTLATLDRIYDLVSGNIASDVRAKVEAIGRVVDHRLAGSVAKAICLLQYVQSVPRTAENLAATLHERVDAPSLLPEVRIALDALVASTKVRLGDDGYRIPTPAEDDWERQRSGLSCKGADAARTHTELIAGFWSPAPSHTLQGVRRFEAGLVFNTRTVKEGDVRVHLTLAETEVDFRRLQTEWRARSQLENADLFWVARIDDSVTRATDEVFRSTEILARKERTASRDEATLVAEEKRRLRRHQDELKRLLRDALLRGVLYFRGNDRSPDPALGDVGRACAQALAQALPEVFDRFPEAAARLGARDLESLLTSENLRGLPQVYTRLGLIREEAGKPVFRTDVDPLREVLARIEHQAAQGEPISGRALTDLFAREPFGWEFDVVRLLVVCLLRAGKIEAVSKGQRIEGALSLEARSTLPNNNLFRQTTFRPKVGLGFEELVKAAEAFKLVFGREIAALEPGAVSRALQEEVPRHEERMLGVHTTLVTHGLPGAELLQAALEQARVLRSGGGDHAILTFNSSFAALKDAIRRAAELEAALTPPHLNDLARARGALARLWPFLRGEPDLPEALARQAETLTDLLSRDTFFRDLPSIDQIATALEAAYGARFEQALAAHQAAFRGAGERLVATPGWEDLSPEHQEQVVAPLRAPLEKPPTRATPIPQIRAETEACPARLARAVEELLRLLDGRRIVQVRVSAYFTGGIETAEQLDAALTGLREECERHLGAGKKLLVQ